MHEKDAGKVKPVGNGCLWCHWAAKLLSGVKGRLTIDVLIGTGVGGLQASSQPDRQADSKIQNHTIMEIRYTDG